MQGETWTAGDIESALAVIRRAIQDEIAGQRFYSDAAYYCIDPWAKEIFATLAQEEEAHARILFLEYQALMSHGHWLDLDVARASEAEVDITRFDFPDDGTVDELFPAQWSAERAIDRTADDLEALAFGIQMEEAAIALYSQAATTTRAAAAQKTYELLVEEETRHYNDLKSRWQGLAGLTFATRTPS